MFELGRELKRLFAVERKPAGEGLSRGDAALLELLDARLLAEEARAADVAAGRISAKDKPRRRLEAAVVWREVARRTGDAAALRKAAAIAETAAAGFEGERRADGWARARCEQAFCALLGAELFGDPGLDAAAEMAFREVRGAVRGGVALALADVGLAAIAGRRTLETCGLEEARAAAHAFAAPIAALEAQARRSTCVRPLAGEARLIRADLLCGWGVRLKDEALLRQAVDEAARAADRLDVAYEPLTWARAEAARGQALALLGELTGDVGSIAAGASRLSETIDHLTRDHSPLDWARAQSALAHALQALGEAAGDPRAFEQAVSCYDRAGLVLREVPALPLRGAAASARAMCLARSAELTGDLAVLDAAEAAMKMELAAKSARRDPVGWALSQLHLARLYETRMGMTGRDAGERASALLSLEAALDVFAEHGLRSLSVLALDALDRLRSDVPSRAAD
ncbi:hypothetical protein PHZ_c2706 [Phenylobacterium zucineum HLK1]|uniref:Uncharacterized protein n=1 Tax=Phenylobacterium zucineum (strain HLK1) TaxID=450851 RepID=B4RHS4_PHEZH|nr:hypothetical protein [Phenylobacterium zucineum]ACG79115.1 hypothetical protein PHZ_c2706 [Phenylobacterium zucineum HLK1]